MRKRLPQGFSLILSVSASVVFATNGWAQSFNSGSTGALGAFNPATNTTVTLPSDGVLNYTTVTIPTGVTVTFTKNAANTPVTLLATGDVTIAGTVSVNGATGANPSSTAGGFNPGAAGGPGGFPGGNGGTKDGLTLPAHGHGPGGAVPATTGAAGSGTYGVQTAFVSLLPLFGGSGGGGGKGNGATNGGGGRGGGGAIVIASSTKITVTGAITANGGSAGAIGACVVTTAGDGSGGAIRLVAPQVTGAGTLSAAGGANLSGCGPGGPGRIRLEAVTLGFTGASTPPFLPSAALGPVTPASTPALANLPTIAFTVGGIVSPPNSGGSYTVADIALPPGTTNPVPVTVTTTNIPAPTTVTVRLLPQFGNATTLSGATSGTTTSASVGFTISFPSGEVSVLDASTNYTLPQIASLFPQLDGESVERVLVAATYGGPSSTSLVTKSGRAIPVEELSREEQIKVALAFGSLRQKEASQ